MSDDRTMRPGSMTHTMQHLLLLLFGGGMSLAGWQPWRLVLMSDMMLR